MTRAGGMLCHWWMVMDGDGWLWMAWGGGVVTLI